MDHLHDLPHFPDAQFLISAEYRKYFSAEKKRRNEASLIQKSTAPVLSNAGLSEAAGQCLLTAAVQNRKKIATCCDGHGSLFPLLRSELSITKPVLLT